MEQHISRGRRGLIAGAAAMVAGILARQPAQTVEAESGHGPDGALIIGSNDEFNRANRATQQTELFTHLQTAIYPAFSVSLLEDSLNDPGACAIAGNANANDGVQGFTQTASGVHGIAAFSDGVGVLGTSANRIGIYGQASTPATREAIARIADRAMPGMLGAGCGSCRLEACHHQREEPFIAPLSARGR